MRAEIGFEFKVIYRDNDLIEVRISVWNGSFGGAANVYLDTSQIGHIATKLQGFPESVSDVREVNFGVFGLESAGGAVSMRFHSIDKSGHTVVTAKIESDYDSSGLAESAILRLPIEPAALDEFVEQLHELHANKTGKAFLRGAVAVR